MVALVSLCQFEIVASVVRKGARGLLKQLHFIDDKIAFFHIPALEIDTEVDGLMVLRGITFSLSTLSFVVHGIEVAIKLTEDIELAISTNKVEVKLFRSITISDCFANLKGGEFEMTFGKLEGNTGVSNRKQVLMEDSPLLKAASGNGDRRTLHSFQSRACKLKMAEKLSDGSVPENFSVREDLKNIEKMNPSRDEATGRYSEMIEFIKETSSIHGASQYAESISKESHGRGRALSLDDNDAVRAELCSQLHGKPSTPHPPSRSIKVTTIQNLVPPYIRRLLHRLPMLLRLLLNPIAYFHPVRITAISAAASGSWINDTLLTKVLHTGLSTDGEISTLQSRVSAWLSDANFVVELGGITCQTQVPFLPSYDIIGQLRSEDVMAYRTLPRQTDLKQVVRFGGADACFGIPSFLLPHHEHILPPIPSASHKANLSENIEQAKGVPKEIEAEHDLEQAEKDEANVKLSVHARLPACFDQELLDWVAALVKATKVIEMEKSESIMDDEVHGVREFGKALRGGLKEGVKKVVVDGVINEKWIARVCLSFLSPNLMMLIAKLQADGRQDHKKSQNGSR
jgi:hypothetical protein